VDEAPVDDPLGRAVGVGAVGAEVDWAAGDGAAGDGAPGAAVLGVVPADAAGLMPGRGGSPTAAPGVPP